MEWKKCYLDMILVPLSLLLITGYHVWLWHIVKTQPLTTTIGTNATGRRHWVASIMRDNDKKNILAVQTLRNSIMGSTLMATTSILLTSGLAAVLSSTYSIKKPLADSVYGGHGEFMLEDRHCLVTQGYVLEVLERGFMLNTIGNRLFYAALPVLLWIFGPVMVFLCNVVLVPVLYTLDVVDGGSDRMGRGGDERRKSGMI